MKKTLKIIGIMMLILILFRGILFRFAVKYEEIGSRSKIEITNEKLIERIEKEAKDREIDLVGISEIADLVTKEELKFTTNRASNNPNELINTKKAN